MHISKQNNTDFMIFGAIKFKDHVAIHICLKGNKGN